MLSCTRAGHIALSDQISKRLTDLGEELGVKFSVGGGQIGESSLTIKVVATTNDPSELEAAAKREFASYARLFGLDATDYGIVFVAGGERYRLTGFAPSRPKYPILATNVRTGKRHKFVESTKHAIIAARSQQPRTPSTTPSQGFAAPAGLPQF